MNGSNIGNPKETAIIVVDMQNAYIHEAGWLGAHGLEVSLMQEMAPHLNEFLSAARKVPGLTVIFIQTLTDEWTAKRNTETFLRKEDWLSDFYVVAPEASEVVITKTRYGAFTGTTLDAVLRQRGLNTLVMTGVGTNVCVESTAREGFMRDYDIVFLSDCTATTSEEDHNATLRNIENWFGTVMKSDDLLKAWSAPVLSVT